MIDAKQLEDLAERLARSLPPGLKGLQSELSSSFREVLKSNLDRFDLVSRERFDAQAELLARTQSRLEALERRLQELEARLTAAR
ncbi:MAG TPA: accessory factor UbiK family protein [Candidatus Binatia bacterium]|nr:accessory factor UbiK family protein [Candidatus Binatia bacterium]